MRTLTTSSLVRNSSETVVAPSPGKIKVIKKKQKINSIYQNPLLDSLGFNAQAVKSQKNDRPIYLDMQATSPLDPRVLDAMLPYMTGLYGNPHFRTHTYGWETEKAVDKAREVSSGNVRAIRDH